MINEIQPFPWGGEPIVFPEGPDTPVKATRYYVNDVPVTVATERVQYFGPDGRLITESLKDYTRKTVHSEYASLDDFLSKWNAADRKQAILDELARKGVFLEELAEQVGTGYDAFDLVCHISVRSTAAYKKGAREQREEAKRVRHIW